MNKLPGWIIMLDFPNTDDGKFHDKVPYQQLLGRFTSIYIEYNVPTVIWYIHRQQRLYED